METWNPILKNLRQSGFLDSTGEKIADSIAAPMLEKLVTFLPKELSKAINMGLSQSDLGSIFGDAFQNMLLASKFQAVLDVLQKTGDVVAKSWEKADQSAYNYGKRIGLTSAQVKGLRDDILRLSDSGAQFGIKYGKSLDDVIKLQTEFSSQLARNIKLTNSQLKDIAALSSVVGDDMAVKLSAQLENFGMSTSQAGELMTQMFNKSMKQGLSLETYAKNVTDNLQIAQQFTFKRGVDGLTAMAEQATKMKLDMQQAISLANKLAEGGIESAVNMSADLQVLGGPFAQFADPMALLHGSLMDMEDLSNRLTDLVGEIGFFNKNTGQIDIGSFDRQRLRAASSSMGLDYGKLIESATQQAKRREIESQMKGLVNIPEEYRELLMNTAQFQNGVAGVRGVNGEFKNLRSLNGEDLKNLANFAKSDSENIRDIAEMLRGMTDIREGTEKEKENERAIMYRTQSEAIKGIYQNLGESKDALQTLVKLELSKTVLDNMVKPVYNFGGKMFGLLGDFLSKKEKGGFVKTHSEGDIITNGQPGKEYILNSAQYGEFIVNKQSTAQHLGLLRAINADKSGNLKIKQHANGGVASLGMPSFGAGMLGMGMFGANPLGVLEVLDNIARNTESFVTEHNPFAKKIEELNKKLGGYIDIKKAAEENGMDAEAVTAKIGEVSDVLEELSENNEKFVQLSGKLAKGVSAVAKTAPTLLAGIGAGVSSWQSYKAEGTDIMNRGKSVGGTIGATAGATLGAALGSMAGPLGTMIGTYAGQAIGQAAGEAIGSGSQVRRSQMRLKFAEGLNSGGASDALMGIKGDFSTRELRQLQEGLKNGQLREYELNDKLVEKLKRTGNGEIFTKTFKNGGLLKGRTHANGGVILNEAEGGEYIVNSHSTAKSMGLLNHINSGDINDSNIKAIEPMGKQLKVKESYSNGWQSSQPMKMEPITININGSIKLDTDDKSFDISKELFNNPTLINKLTDIITKQLNIDENGTFNRKEYRRRYSSV